MGTLGKVLLFVNLLAAAGLTYLAAQDWTKRREVTGRALQHHLALKGLAVDGAADGDDVKLNLELSGGRSVATVGKGLLAEHFKGSDGGPNFGDPAPPVGQLAELSRVKGKVKAVLAGLGGPTEKLAYLCGSLSQPAGRPPVFSPGLLARLATTFEERTLVANLVDPGVTRPAGAADAAAKAEGLLDGVFAAAETVNPTKATDDAAQVKTLSDDARKAAADADAAFKQYLQDIAAAQQQTDEAAARTAIAAAGQRRKAADDALAAAQAAQADNLRALGGTASRDATDQRRRIARVLAEVDPAAAWQKRTALVVGLRTYRDAVADQVDRLREMARSAQALAVSDQAAFTERYLLLRNQAATRTLLLAQQQQITADLVAQLAKEREATTLRRGQFVTRQADLAAVRKDVGEALARQTAVEAELFTVQRQVGDALRLNFDLEDRLRQAETQSAGKN